MKAAHFSSTKLLQSHDRTLRLLTSREIIVSVILLVGNGRDAAGKPHSLLTHPEADARGVYSMPNLTGEDPARLYAVPRFTFWRNAGPGSTAPAAGSAIDPAQ
ncbi:MAG: hypothetical protein R3F31_09075 [Verrucomicrobiales bacterium]